MESYYQDIASIFIILSTSIVFFLLTSAFNWNKWLGMILISWLIVQLRLSTSGFYEDVTSVPPRLLLLIGPSIMAVLALFLIPKTRNAIVSVAPERFILLHGVRVLVEVALFLLAAISWVPKLMTFEGTNFDIVSGLTAPLVWYFGYKNSKLSKTGIVAWNVVCLVLLGNIVVTALLSAQTPFQQFSFEQPNIAVRHFPFVWLASFIVPAVLFCHIQALLYYYKNR